MARKFIQQFGPADRVDQVFLASQKQLRVNKNGNSYLQVELADRSGSISARMWNAGEHEARQFEDGDYVRVEGNTQLFQGALQLIAVKIAKAKGDEIDEAEARRLARSLASWEHFNAANIAQLDFYIAAKAGARGNRHLFQKHMAACAAAEGMDHIIPELWIARYEAGMLPFQFPKGEYKAAGHPTKKVRRRRIES